MLLAPLRGVTIRTFRLTFCDVIREVGFTEVVTPFLAANAGVDPLKDRELKCPREDELCGYRVTPQFIGKDPAALRAVLQRIKDAGYETADLNCGCPYPMIRGKGRGSGLMRTPDVLRRMLEVGCEVMGPQRFSVKTRLGIDSSDEIFRLIPIFNEFPLRFLTVHARTAKQMYEGACDPTMWPRIEDLLAMPLIRNGDLSCANAFGARAMVGRDFIRALGAREDIHAWLMRYIDASRAELSGDRPVLGRMKELLAYWKDLPFWHRRWHVIKMARTVDELITLI